MQNNALCFLYALNNQTDILDSPTNCVGCSFSCRIDKRYAHQ